MAKRVKVPKRGKLAAAFEDATQALQESAHDPARRAVAVSALAGGAIAAGKFVRDRSTERARHNRARRYRLEPGESPREGIGALPAGSSTWRSGCSATATATAAGGATRSTTPARR